MKIEDFSTRDRVGIAITPLAFIWWLSSHNMREIEPVILICIYWAIMFIFKKIDFLFNKKDPQ